MTNPAQKQHESVAKIWTAPSQFLRPEPHDPFDAEYNAWLDQVEKNDDLMVQLAHADEWEQLQQQAAEVF